MARLMRAEALSDGALAMLMVGNVIVNRVIVTCDLFKNIRTIEGIVYQSPGGFVGSTSSLFQSSSTTKEKNLAKRCLRGEYFYPATSALWLYAPGKIVVKKFGMVKNFLVDINLIVFMNLSLECVKK